MSIDYILDEMKEISKKKNSEDHYGDSYKEFGNVMVALYPNGLELNTVDDWNEFGVLQMVIHKLIRLSKVVPLDRDSNVLFEKPRDNTIDLSVYGAMLAELFDIRQSKQGDTDG